MIPEVKEVQIAFSPRGEALSQILHELRGAKQRVDVAMFYLSEKDLVDALCFLAQRRGVAVRVLTDGWMATAAHAPVLKKLSQYGVSVFVLRLPGSARMHLKCAVIDGETIIAGAANWTSTAFDQNFEDTLIINSKELGKRYTDHLDEVMAKAEPFQETVSAKPPRASFPEIEQYEPFRKTDRFQAPRSKIARDVRQMEVYFTPGRNGIQRLLSQIRDARQRVDIGIYLLTDPEIIRTLAEVANRGAVKIRMLIDSGMLSGTLLASVQTLWDAGVDIHYYQKDRESLHLKTAVIDGRYVWTGTANWTAGAMSVNVEDMLLFESSEMARYYTQFLDGIKEVSQPFERIALNQEVAEVEVSGAYDRSGLLVGLPLTGPRTEFTRIDSDPPFPAFDVEAVVSYLPDEEYFPVLMDLFRNAHQSIIIAMYVMSETTTEAKHQAEVIRELEQAAARGVYVYLLLQMPPSVNDRLSQSHSNWAEMLRAKGIDVRLSLPNIALHDKMVIVDLAKVLIGSHNWSDGALSGTRVYESSALLVLPKQDLRLANYVLSRQVISDMRSRELWEQEIGLFRHIRSLFGQDRIEFIREMEAKARP